MIHIINNILDLLWILLGGISMVVLIAILTPWRFVYELILLTLLVIWIAIKFWLREGWRAVKKLFRKKYRWIDSEHDSFI